MVLLHLRRKMKHLDWYMTMKKTSDKRNAKYYAARLLVLVVKILQTPGFIKQIPEVC